MKRLITAASTVAVVLVAAAVAAQGTPNFAGKWTLDPASAPAQSDGGGRGRGRMGGMGGMLGTELTITQDAGTLTLEYTAGMGRRGGGDGMTPPAVKLVYKLDGSESRNRVMGRGGEGMEQVSKAVWEGAALVVTTTTPIGEQRRIFSLDGGNLKITTTLPGNPNFGSGQPTTTTAIYKKSE